jgi:hypothetical protein
MPEVQLIHLGRIIALGPANSLPGL